MQNRLIAKLAASSLMLGVTMVGCKPAADGSRPRSAAQIGSQPERQAGAAAEAALAAVGKRDFVTAVTQAEASVALSPRDAGYRATLAEIYLKSGRFDSAAAAYRDALQLNPQDARAKLSLALTQIGLGRNADAIATLGAVDGQVAPADHGLALALAGDRQGAIALLSGAAREEGASARVRQNLALAYALAGDWTQARAIAAQDVPADELDARMASWAEFTAPKGTYDQVATLLGVSPTADNGQPARLALNPDANATAQLASIDPVAPVGGPYEPDAQGEPVAEVALAQVDTLAVKQPTDEVEPAAPVLAALASIEAVLPAPMARSVGRTIRAAASAPTTLKGRYVVQLGAFAGAGRVERAWNIAVGRMDRLSNYVPASTPFAVAGGTLTRLSVGGFATRGPATALCDSLRRAGGSCFVRATAGDAPVRWASRATRNG